MEQFYFKINLNKFGELRQKMQSENKIFNNALIGFLVVSALLYGFVLYLGHTLDVKKANREHLLTQIEDEIKKYQASGDYLSANDLERLAIVSSDRIFWTKKLEALADKTMDEIAITNFSFNRNTLSLYGITKVQKDRKEFDYIDEFIVNLKNNKQISSDFANIKFVKSYRDKEKDVDIIRFQIDCQPAAVKKEVKQAAKEREE